MNPSEHHSQLDVLASDLLTAVVDSSEDAIIITNIYGIILAWNRGAEKVYGYTKSEIVGKPISQLIPEDRIHELTYIFDRLHRDLPVERYETVRLRKNGERIDVSLTWRPLKSSSGELVGAMLAVRDLSGLREAKAALRQRETEFRAVFENAGVGIVLLDRDGKCIQSNPFFQELLGYSAEELRNISFVQYTHPETLDAQITLLDEMIRGERDYYQIEKRYIRKDGTEMWGRLTASLVRDSSGEPMFTVGIVEDITERKHMDEIARESRQRLGLLVQQTPLGVISWDLDFRITEWNSAAEKMFGFTKEEVLGRHGLFLNPESAREHVRQVWDGLLQGTGGKRSTNENMTKAGKVIQCEWYNSRLVDASGNLVGVASMVQDVTAQQELESQLRHSQKMEAVGRLAGGVAHDFNNLLNVIIGHAALMKNKNIDEALREHTDEIFSAAQKAAALTRQLLAFSRKQVLQPTVLDLNEVVQDLRMLARVIGEDIELRLVPAEEPTYVQADRGQIEQVILNLALNARDAMPRGGRLTIETAKVTLSGERAKALSVTPGEYVELVVTDTGHGMDAATQTRIFEPFFTTKEVGKGTGLGLATVHGVVTQSGGQIFVESELQVGTTFTILLPFSEASAEVAAEEEKKVVQSVPIANRGSETILLAEDEEGLRRLTRHILEKNGYTVIEARDGGSALEAARLAAGKIDLLITDLVMPGMRGYDLAKLLRESRPSIRVLYISGYADAAVERQVADGLSGLLEKPFTPDALMAKIDEILSPVRIARAS